MCGIFACSFTPETSVNARELSRALLEAIEDRGREATGFGYFTDLNQIETNNAPIKASDFTRSKREFTLPAEARTVIGHTRLATKGTINNPLNNHPVGAFCDDGPMVAAVHNGGVWNDDDTFEKFALTRYGQVDSEAIPAMIAEFGSAMYASIFTELEGGIATCWLDERTPGTLHAVRAWDSPMVIADIDTTDKFGFAVQGVIIASTVKALTAGLKVLGLDWSDEGIAQYEIGEGEYLSITDGVWDRLVYPFSLPDVTSRWGSGWRGRNASTQGYVRSNRSSIASDIDDEYGWSGYGSYGGRSYPSGYAGIGTGKVETGKPSTYVADSAGTLTKVTDDGTVLNEDTPAVLDPRINGHDDEGNARDYSTWWADQLRITDLQDLMDRLRDEDYVPTTDEVRLLAGTSVIEQAGLGITKAMIAEWDAEYAWHMVGCTEGNCHFDNPECPSMIDYTDEAAIEHAAKVWGFATC